MKNINNIIASELIVRANNINFRTEYGEVGSATNISDEGTHNVFTTKYEINNVIYVTVNGVNLTEGIHYTVVGKSQIKISEGGTPVRDNPGITTNILVGYMFTKRLTDMSAITKVATVVPSFYLDRTIGRDGKVVFNFVIEPNDGTNIYWSILKDGNDVPLFSGNTFETINGFIPDGLGGQLELAHYVSPEEYNERQGDKIPFTFIVIYDLTDDGSHLNEKIIKSATYELEQIVPITADIESLPSYISMAGNPTVNINYSVISQSSSDLFDWKVTRSFNGGAETIVKQGNQYSVDMIGNFTEVLSLSPGDNFDIRYSVYLMRNTDAVYILEATDKTTVVIPAAAEVAKAGYLDANIMNYESPLGSGIWFKIGSLGTAQDIIEYENRVPRDIFTKDVSESYLTNGQFIQAPVNTFGNTVSAVYFVLEAPTSWGALKFFQFIGEVDISGFNMINLGNGFTAYMYKVAPSAVTSPSDYYITRA